MNNILEIKNRYEFREWLIKNHNIEKECWIVNSKRGKPADNDGVYYLNLVEEALCFGWIDSVFKNIDGIHYQKFSPRLKNSNWTELNIARCKRLEHLGLMTEDGLKVIHKVEFVYDEEIMNDIKNKGIYDTFMSFPELYRKIRISNLLSMKSYSIEKYETSFNNFLKKTKEGKMIPGWDDYGRLSNL